MTEIMEQLQPIDTAPTLSPEQEKELRNSLEALFSWRGVPGKRGGEPDPVRAVGIEAFRVILDARGNSLHDRLPEGDRRYAERVVAELDGLNSPGVEREKMDPLKMRRVTVYDGLGLETIRVATQPHIVVRHSGALALELADHDSLLRTRIAGFNSVTLHDAA